MRDAVADPATRTKIFRLEMEKKGGRRLDVALDGEALAALDLVRMRRGFAYPRHVFSTLLAEEKARLDSEQRPERPEVTAINAGVIVRSILACLPPTDAARQRALADFLGPVLRAAIEVAHAASDRLTLLRLLTFVPLDDAAVERALAVADSTDVSVATRRSLDQQARQFLGREDRDGDYDLLESALETLLWNGLLRG